ncbi:type IV pilin protein [Dyella sp. GSA-30]|uniref:type IV pilin protein n=1 Tax=Dyella sp. GSA-30 TaxID=2994496 RepID=UPI002493B679|nr:type IV pilin protein [Dyella sp. GSA-30]BDU21009.1 pilus assembly protein PilE [Dyella sp. GSA-30]
MHRRQSGFTLIEIMIVVMIVAILAAIAIPAYHRYVVRAHRTDATRTLLDLAGRQEHYFYSNNTYTTDVTALGGTTTMAGQFYAVAITSADTKNFSITATAIGLQATEDTECGNFTINRQGQQTISGTGTKAACWGN